MAFNMEGEIELAASREIVWKMLNDPQVLKECIPGCEELQEVEGGFKAIAKMKVGPVSARFVGQVKLSNLDRPNATVSPVKVKAASLGSLKGGRRSSCANPRQGHC